MKVFKFNQEGVCPICGTNKEGEAVLIPIDGTNKDSEFTYESEQVHLDCLELILYKNMDDSRTSLIAQAYVGVNE